MIADSQKRKDK